MPELSTECPYCSSRMTVRTIRCQACRTEITGDFAPSALMALAPSEQQFIVQFVLSSGSLKAMAEILGVSYPTVRARLDRLIEKLRGERLAAKEKRAAILDAIEEKELTAAEAADLLRGMGGSGEGEN